MNTNPNAVRVLCFGDSNTWGYVSGRDHDRLSSDKRWPGVLQKLLGTQYEVIEEGLNARTISTKDPRPDKPGRKTTEYVFACLDTHDPLDWVILMLGTNDCKNAYHLAPERISLRMSRLLQRIKEHKPHSKKEHPQIMLISPPLIHEVPDYWNVLDKYLGAAVKSRRIGALYEQIAAKLRIQFLDSAPIAVPGVDGVHITEKGHRRLAEEIARKVKG